MVPVNPLGCLFSTFLLSAYFSASYAQLESTAQPEVTIPQGILLGTTLETRNGRDVFAFQGIPYGQPPIGNLRFADPVAAGSWNGTLNATDDSSMCPQMTAGQFAGSEDCLYINVYTPQLPQDTNSSLLPVMVFIHGGAFKGGSKDASRVSPVYLLDKDLLLVAPNYRVGPIGFLSTGDEVASGNWGLKDQVLALKWIQDNIQYFGGDPDQVTLVGESAGAGSVHLLTLSNATIGLFHQYITESGSALGTWAHRPRAAYARRAFELGEYVGCSNDTSEALISCLRTIDVSNIADSQSVFLVWNHLPDIVWGPTDEPDVDGAILTDSPANLFAAGGIRDLPWMVGVVRDEGLILTTALYTNEENLHYFLENIDYLLPIMLSLQYQSDAGAAWVSAAKEYYFNNDLTGDTSEILEKLTMLVGDSHFYWSTRNALEQQYALATNPGYYFTFNYRGTYSTTSSMGGGTTDYGVAHGDELYYLFPHDSVFADLNRTMTDTDYEMVDTMVELWTSFVINGTPTSTALNGVAWNPYSTEDCYLRIGNGSDVTPEVQYSFFKERMQFWANLYATSDTETETETEAEPEIGTGTEAEPETEASASQDSGTVTLSSNLLFLLLVVCSKFVL